jgi:hypothetical protein
MTEVYRGFHRRFGAEDLSTIRVSSLVPPTEVGGSSVDPFCDSGIADYQWCQHCQREQHAVREPCAGETDPLR